MADGDILRVGRQHTSSAETRITRSGAANLPAFTVFNNGSGTGVFGTSNANAIFGRSTSRNDSGVYGENTGGGYGTAGRSAGPQPAVWGDNTGTGHGVFGTTPSAEHSGVYGHNHGSGHGVMGRTGGNGAGVFGQHPAGAGVLGQTSGTGGELVVYAGVRGEGGDYGVYGRSPSAYGVYGQGPWAVTGNNFGEPGLGVKGHSDRGYAISGSTNPSSGGKAGAFFGPVLVQGDLEVRGTKSATIEHPDGSLRKLYALESPDSWFEDFGRAQVVQGRALVELDPDFASVVQTEDYYVFLTPEGDSKGLFVSSRNPTGFEVREQQDGANTLTFSYRVVAKRGDLEAERFQTVEEAARPEDILPPLRREDVAPPAVPPEFEPPSVREEAPPSP